MYPTEHFPSKRPATPCAYLAHGGAWRDHVLEASGGVEVARGQAMLWGPIPSSLHCCWTCNYNALSLSQLVITYGDK